MICPSTPVVHVFFTTPFGPEGCHFILLWAVMYTAEMTMKFYLTGFVCICIATPSTVDSLNGSTFHL